MKYMCFFGRLPEDNSLLEDVNSAAGRLYSKLKALDIDTLSIFEYNNRYCKSKMASLTTNLGRGEDFSKYRKMMAHKDSFIVHNDFITHRMVAELFQQTSIVVLPYTDGSQSGVIPQAYAFKKPVVITDVGSLPENVDDGETGHIVPPKDPKRLANAIIDLLLDSKKRNKMGLAGFKKTRRELSWSTIARDTIEVYKKALTRE